MLNVRYQILDTGLKALSKVTPERMRQFFRVCLEDGFQVLRKLNRLNSLTKGYFDLFTSQQRIDILKEVCEYEGAKEEAAAILADNCDEGNHRDTNNTVVMEEKII